VRVRRPDGTVVTQAAIGRGPVDATFRAIDAVVDLPATLLEYQVHAVTEGIDALGEVSVRIRDPRGGLHGGYGADTDIIVASAKSYLVALERMRKAIGAQKRASSGENA
jgi:2-isopropylmalate synthase